MQNRRMKQRAQRFPIQTPIQFREGGEEEWSSGATLNISRSGVLFSSARELSPSAMLEMLITFPEEFEPVDLLCWGPVVRKDELRSAFAAQIVRHRLVRK